MALNVVEILVRAKNETQGAFAEADATATGFSKALRTTMLVGAGAVALVGYESVKMATTFQASMERLVTQAGVPQSALKGLSQGVLDLAGKVGFSPDSLAASLYHVSSNMESMGGTSAQMLNVVKVAAEGARVGGANLVDVTTALTSAVASQIPGVKNYAQAMGMLNATVGTGEMTMQQLAEAMSTGILPVMKQYGLSMKDVGAALATFGDLNIRGSEAATKLRMAVLSMAAPSAQGKKDFAAMGMSVNQLGQDMRTGGLMKALLDLQKHYAAVGITGTKVGAALTQDFTKKAGVGLAVLLGNMDRLQSKYPALQKAASGFGDAWAKTNTTLAQKLADLRGKFDAVMVGIGDKLLPAVTRLAGFILSTLIPAIGKITSWLAKHRDAILAVAVGIMAALVPAFLEWAATAGAAAVATIVAAAPLILLGAGIALVVYAILQLAHHWKQVWHDLKAWALDAWHWIDNDVIHPIERGIADLVSWIGAHWKLLAVILGTVLLGPVGGLIVFIATHWAQFKALTGRLVDDVVHFFEQLPGMILRALSSLGSMLFRAGQNAMSGLIHGLMSMIGAVGSAVGGIAHKVAGFFGLSPAKEGPLSGGGAPEIRGRHFVQEFARGMTDGLPDLGRTVSAVAGRAGGFGPGTGGGAGGRVVLEFRGGQSVFDQFMLEWVRKTVQAKGGGDVQVTFGRTA